MDGKVGEWGTIAAGIIISSVLGCSEGGGRATGENPISATGAMHIALATSVGLTVVE